MFYAHFVLSKKGPLARIWLAAHWDKKLTRAHVFETNITSSVEAILEPKLKMALRTSGHLLLGVVRIYSRKAKYLLADCNEAFVKIKMAFRPGVVDLPDDANREAAIAAITLPENIHDFEATIADLNRPEDITMREDFGEINLGRQDDDFGDSAFDEVSSREIIRGDKTFDGIYRASDQLSVHHGGDFSLHSDQDMDGTLIDSKRSRLHDSDKQIKSVDSSQHDDIGIDDNEFEGNFLAEPDDDEENFGGGLVDYLFTDNIFKDPAAQKQLEHLTSEIESHMQGGATPVPSTTDETQDDKHIDLFATTRATTMNNTVTTIHKSTTEATTVQTESTSLLGNESEAFALPPIEATSTGFETRKVGKRKRRLIVDEQKSIPSEIMKSQMENTSDIITQLDLAPPTKKLMHWKETGSVDKLFTLPGRSIPSRVLQRLFVRNLYTQAVPDDEETFHTAAMGLNQTSGNSHSSEAAQSISQLYSPELSHEPKDQLGAIPEVPEEKSNESKMTTPLHLEEFVNTAADDDDNDLGFMVQPETPYLAPPSILSEAPPSVMQVDMLELERELAAADDEVENALAFRNASTVLPSHLASEEAVACVETLSTIESLEEKRLEKRSKILLRILHTHQMQHGWQEPLTLQNLCSGNTKKQAASKFYTILLLRKQGAVELSQEAAYSNILISKGANFSNLIEN